MDPAILAPDLEPISFDALALGGEWTTRRRTISDSEIALFAAVAGDFSPLSVDGSGGSTRLAQPALLVAAAIGLGSMDMPSPLVATWEWANWKFPKPVKAGETIYARWVLTQKRPPVGGSPSAIAVWRVDVHTADGALCAEGEVGASVFRRSAPTVDTAAEAPAQGASRRRRRRRTGTAPEAPPAVAPPPASGERASGSRRRRRRRSSGGQGAANGEPSAATPAPAVPASADVAPAEQAPRPAGSLSGANPLRRVIGRLRKT